MISLPRLFALVLIPLTLLLLLLACGSEEPTARPDSSRSDRSTSAPSSTSEGTTVSPTAVEDRPTIKGTSTYMLDLIPATTQVIFLLDLKTIRENLNRFPGDFDVLKRELSERIDDELDTGAIEIEQVDEVALPVAVEDSWNWSTVVLKGNFDFAGIRATYEEANEERLSYGGYDGYTTWRGEIVVLLEDKGMIYKSSEEGVRDLLDILNSGSGSLADVEAEDNELKRILDELGGSPAVVATVVKEDSDDDDCGNIVGSDDVAGCMGIGSAYSGSDDAKDEVYVDIVVLFSSERAAEQAADDSEVITSLMEEWLEDILGDVAKFIGLDSAEPRGVSDVDTDDDLAKGTGTIGLGQPLPPPTPRPTRAPTATSEPAATTIPRPQATPAIQATPFRPQAATQAIEATPSRPQAATQAIEATPSRPQATPPQPAPAPAPTPRATVAPTAGPPMAQTSPETDREALVALYNATGGPNWNANNNWLSDVPISQWSGVTADNNGRVTTLILNRNNLSGEIPPELGNLTSLRGLGLVENQLSGEIPPELGNLVALIDFGLGDNQLSGEIPPEFGSLANLRYLILSDNQLSGEIPPALGNLARLGYLSLSDNQLSGEIPPELGNLASLNHLILGDNQLSGEIPPELGNLANLQALLLAGNQLSGCVPSSLSGRLYMPRSDLGGLQFCP